MRSTIAQLSRSLTAGACGGSGGRGGRGIGGCGISGRGGSAGRRSGTCIKRSIATAAALSPPPAPARTAARARASSSSPAPAGAARRAQKLAPGPPHPSSGLAIAAVQLPSFYAEACAERGRAGAPPRGVAPHPPSAAPPPAAAPPAAAGVADISDALMERLFAESAARGISDTESDAWPAPQQRAPVDPLA